MTGQDEQFPTREFSDVIHAPELESFEQHYVTAGKPVVVRGVTDHWAAMSKWSHTYLANVGGHITVQVSRKRGRDRRQMTLSAFLDYASDTTDEDPFYLANWAFSRDLPCLLEDYQNPSIFSRLEGRLPTYLQPDWRWIFIGPAGSGTALHVDVLYTSAWNVVISGRKRWRFFPPEQVQAVYRGEVDSFAPDLDTHPLFRDAHAIECVQEPGDLVFTPSGWWHQVTNELPGISITENFINASNLENVKLVARREKIPHFEEALAVFD